MAATLTEVGSVAAGRLWPKAAKQKNKISEQCLKNLNLFIMSTPPSTSGTTDLSIVSYCNSNANGWLVFILCGICPNSADLWASHSALNRSRYTGSLVYTPNKLLSIIPPGGPQDYVLEIAARMEIAPLLHSRLGYGHVRGCVPGAAGQVEAREADGFAWQVDRFDLERDFYPYPSAHFRTIVCVEILETLTHDPMYMMDEIHRILRPRCDLVLTTRRYSSEQIQGLLVNCGLAVTLLETEQGGVYAVGRKIGPLRERYPQWLYPK